MKEMKEKMNVIYEFIKFKLLRLSIAYNIKHIREKLIVLFSIIIVSLGLVIIMNKTPDLIALKPEIIEIEVIKKIYVDNFENEVEIPDSVITYWYFTMSYGGINAYSVTQCQCKYFDYKSVMKEQKAYLKYKYDYVEIKNIQQVNREAYVYFRDVESKVKD